MSGTNSLLRRAVVAALTLAAVPAVAQDTATSEDGRTIENIIVTAQKREQNLQDVPIVVTAVSEQLLKDTGIKDIKDLTLVAPGLTVTSTSSEASTTARIRGVGTVGDNPGLESSVGVVIDGVYRPRNGVGFGDLGELERIEVLKGPQGTLFGKNTSAGVVNVVTKKPKFDFESELELSAGDYGAMEGAASITGPIGETIAGRLYVAARERDGYLDINRANGPRTEDEDNDRSVQTARGQLLFAPSEALEIRVTADYSERDENCCAAPQLTIGPSAAALNALAGGNGVANPADPYERLAYSNRLTTQEIEDQGVSAEINWDLDALGGATLTSITAARAWETLNAQDVDFSGADVWHRDPDGNQATEFDQISQELRLSGTTDRLTWLVGAFYAGEDLTSKQQLQYGSQYGTYLLALIGAAAPAVAPLIAGQYPLGSGSRDVHEQESETFALFTNNNIQITDALELTLGLRYTEESKDLATQYLNTHNGQGCQNLRNGIGGIPAAARPTVFGIGCIAFTDPIYNNLANEQSLDEGEWSGTAKLAYRFTDEFMSYASYARGYKASGFNLDRVRTGSSALNPGTPGGVGAALDTSFDKELVDSYEVGVKTQWLENSLLLNATVFYQDYQDFQLNTFDGVQFTVQSLEQVTSEGVDVDIVWFTPLEQLSLQGGVTYAETEIKDEAALANALLFNPARDNNRLSFAPEWSASMSGTFEQPIGSNLLLRANLSAKYTSAYNTGSDLDPPKRQDPLTVLNARLGFGAANERWMVEVWALNLTDEEYLQVAFDAPLQGATSFNAFLAPPVTYGATARFKF